jgi:hypothetical protein
MKTVGGLGSSAKFESSNDNDKTSEKQTDSKDEPEQRSELGSGMLRTFSINSSATILFSSGTSHGNFFTLRQTVLSF